MGSLWGWGVVAAALAVFAVVGITRRPLLHQPLSAVLRWVRFGLARWLLRRYGAVPVLRQPAEDAYMIVAELWKRNRERRLGRRLISRQLLRAGRELNQAGIPTRVERR